jgi:prolipoprotein diacylglyceryl transferase
MVRPPLSYIPGPWSNGFHVNLLFIHLFFHFYGLMYVIGITLAVYITGRRLRAYGADPALVNDVALWAVPAGIIGGRIYFDVTTPAQIPHEWYGVLAVWQGGLGIWGGIAAGALAGIWRLRRRGAAIGPFADAVAPALLVAQAVGRIGNYFNQELFGRPTTLPWGLQIAPQFRPAGYTAYHTFHPTFLYELIWDLALAALLVWLGHHARIRPPGLFALYVTGYSAFRIYEESLRIDYSQHFLGLRLNTFVASALAIAGVVWFIYIQRRPRAAEQVPSTDDPSAATGDEADTDLAGEPGGTSETEASDASEASATQAGVTSETDGDDADSPEPKVTATASAQENHSDA